MDKKVLIVNYEPKSLLKLEKLISGAGFEVSSAKDGVEALESVENSKPDLLIIDPMLPKLSGFEVSKKVSEKHPEIPIIIITSVYKGIKYKNEALTKYGAKDFFEVPFDEAQLLSRVIELLGGNGKEEQQSQPIEHHTAKKSSKRRLEDILEETISGTMKDFNKPAKKKAKSPQDDGVVFTSEDIFSDVINDVEKSENVSVDKAPKNNFINSDSVNLEVENQLEKTLSGLNMGKKSSKKSKPKFEPKEELKQVVHNEPEFKKSAVIVEANVDVAETNERQKDEVKKHDKKKVVAEGIEYGSYVLLEKVATGGMAELFKAKRRGVQGFQKIVAIKKILSHLIDNEDFVTMFIDEAKLAAQLNHPNIAQIYDLGKIEKSFYIAMEYVEGYDLRNIYKECQKKSVFMPEPLVLYVASKILSALDYAHRKKGLDMKDLKIVHRDVSPQNILISKDGDVKLVDFGIAKAATKASQTQAGALKGKLLYMSPEQAWGKAIDNRSDLFSLGSVLYEGLTDKKCFLADSEISILEKVRSVKYESINDLNPSISGHTIDIVTKSLAKENEERYQSAKEMEQEIGKMLDALPFAVRERELADFIDALYTGNIEKINEIKTAMTVEKEDKKAVVTNFVKEEKKPEPTPIPQVKKDNLKEVKKAEPIKPDTSTVIMPDIEDAQKYEDEMLEKMGSSGSKYGVLVGVILVVVVALVGYFVVYPRMKGNPTKMASNTANLTKPEVKQILPNGADTNIVNDEETKNLSGATENDAAKTQEDKTTVDDKTLANNDVEKPVVEESQGLEGFDQKKLVDELVKQKIAAREAAMKDQIKNDAEARKLELQKQIDAANKEKELLAQKAAEAKKIEDAKAKTEEDAKLKAKKDEETKKVEADKAITTPASNGADKVDKKVEVSTNKPQSQPAPLPTLPKLKTGDLVPLIEGEVQFPEIIDRVEPKKTAAARRMKIKGIIVAQVLIDENGEIKDVRILRNIPGNHGLDEQVIKALKQWTFKPAVKNGIRVSVYYTQTFSF